MIRTEQLEQRPAANALRPEDRQGIALRCKSSLDLFGGIGAHVSRPLLIERSQVDGPDVTNGVRPAESFGRAPAFNGVTHAVSGWAPTAARTTSGRTAGLTRRTNGERS
jgi:hypothetical protein